MRRVHNHRKVIIIGEHPIVESVVRQYDALQMEVAHLAEWDESVDINEYDEIFMISDTAAQDAVDEDNKVIAQLGLMAQGYHPEEHSGNLLRCHLLLRSQEVLQRMRTCDYHEDIKSRVDVYPFTMNDLWSQSIRLDWEPITKQSEKTAHLVIFGAGQLAESVAIHAAHVAHFPNYVHNHKLRTRITIVDENIEEWSLEMITRYRQLFDHSFYRMVNPSKEKMVTEFHWPKNYSEQREFVDVEWEFVEASVYERTVRMKLKQWADSDRQLLTLVFTHPDEHRNMADAMCLPDKIYEKKIPVYVYRQQEDCSYDVTLPLVRMAMNVNYIYDQCYNDNDKGWSGQVLYTVEIDAEAREDSWRKKTAAKKMSNIYNAMTVPVKMRSLGLKEDDWDKFYDISQQDIDLLAEVEHNRWSVEELILGWRPCTPEEEKQVEGEIAQKEVLKKRMIHYDLRPYNDLRADKTGKSVKAYDQCVCAALPLIAKAAADEQKDVEGGEPC